MANLVLQLPVVVIVASAVGDNRKMSAVTVAPARVRPNMILFLRGKGIRREEQPDWEPLSRSPRTAPFRRRTMGYDLRHDERGRVDSLFGACCANDGVRR